MNEQEIKCKWLLEEIWTIPNRCIRHAPIAVPNPEYDGYKGDNTKALVLTDFPVALCPCGDYEPRESERKDNESRV